MQIELLLSMPGGSEWIIIFSLLAFLALWIKTLFEIASSNYKDQATKVIWFLVVFFLNLPGIFIYYILGRPTKNQLT